MKEALHILNYKNYEKDLSLFRDDFNSIKIENLTKFDDLFFPEYNSIFELNIVNKEKVMKSILIKVKESNDNNDIWKSISFNKRNDTIGRYISPEDYDEFEKKFCCNPLK